MKDKIIESIWFVLSISIWSIMAMLILVMGGAR